MSSVQYRLSDTQKRSQRGSHIPRSPVIKRLRTNSSIIDYDSYWLRQVPKPHIPLRLLLSKSGVVQDIQVGFCAHHDITHVNKLVTQQSFGVQVRNVQVGVNLEHVDSTQVSVHA